MGELSRAQLKRALHRHYAAQREAATLSSQTVDELAVLMCAEDARTAKIRPCNRGLAAFLAAQVRYIPAWTWAAQMALVALMCVIAHAPGNVGGATMAKLAVSILSAMSVLVGVPTVHASKLHGVAELECACPNNAASVMVARLIVLGCSSALAVGLMVAATAAGIDADVIAVALCVAPPFFCSCAGSLLALRKAPPASALAYCVAWTAGCCFALVMLAGWEPSLYANASLAVWAIASALACLWLACELAATVRVLHDGLDAFSPQRARTFN